MRAAIPPVLAALLTACAGQASPPAPAPTAPPPPTVVASAAPTAAASPTQLRAARPPTGLTIDGSIAEWSSVTPAIDRQGLRLWIASDARGLFFAGEVADAADAAGAAPLVLTVTTPRPKLPVLGYLRDSQVMSVAEDEACEKLTGDSDTPEERARAECHTWRVEQLDRRAQIERRFTKSYPVTWKGRAFEVALPLAELPPFSDVSLASIDLSMALPGGALRAAVVLDTPLRGAPEGSLTSYLLDSDQKGEDVVAFYEPARPEQLHYLFNEARGFSLRPKTPSPDELVVDLSKRKRIVALGELVVETLEGAIPPVFFHRNDLMLSRLGDRVVEVQTLGRNEVSGVLHRRPDTADLVLTYVGIYNTFGGGTCGMCPVALLNVATVHDDGRFDEPWWHEELGGGPPVMFEPIAATASPDGRRIVVRGNRIEQFERPDGRTASRVPGGREITFTWSPGKGDFTRGERAIAKMASSW